MKQIKNKASIWFKPKKGIRAGNSPVWTVVRETPSGRRDEWKGLTEEKAKKIKNLALDESENWPGHRDVWMEEED